MLRDSIVEEAPGVTLEELGLRSAFREEVLQVLWGVLSRGGAHEHLPLIQPGAGNGEWDADDFPGNPDYH
jgi:hypothetical protein